MSQAHEVKPSHMDPDPAKRHPGFIHVCQECYEKHHKDNDTAHPVHERFLEGKQCEQPGVQQHPDRGPENRVRAVRRDQAYRLAACPGVDQRPNGVKRGNCFEPIEKMPPGDDNGLLQRLGFVDLDQCDTRSIADEADRRTKRVPRDVVGAIVG